MSKLVTHIFFYHGERRVHYLRLLQNHTFDTSMGDCYSHGLSKSAIFFFENNCGKSVDEHQWWGFESSCATFFSIFFKSPILMLQADSEQEFPPTIALNGLNWCERGVFTVPFRIKTPPTRNQISINFSKLKKSNIQNFNRTRKFQSFFLAKSI